MSNSSVDLLFKDEVYAIVGAAMEVHSTLGSSFLEAVYHEAFALELGWRGIPFKSQEPLTIQYKHATLKKTYEPDFLVMDEIIVEIKAQEQLTTREEGQLLNYLHVSGKRVGLLINFGSTGKLEWKRFVV